MRNNCNAQDLQISALSTGKSHDMIPGLIRWIQVIAWFLAIASIVYSLGIIALWRSEIHSFAVSESGVVVEIKPIDPDAMDKLLQIQIKK